MNHPPDPAGVFASDFHRRVAAHLPLPYGDAIPTEAISGRLVEDLHTALDGDPTALATILDDLSESGDAKYLEGAEGWKLTKDGFGRLTGPITNEPPPLEGAALARAEQHDARIAEEEAAADAKAKAGRVEAAENELAAAKAAQKED